MVVIFVGVLELVIEVVFQVMKKASEVIDMFKYIGEYFCMGVMDVCLFIFIVYIIMEEVVEWVYKLARCVGEELGIFIYMYESVVIKFVWCNLVMVCFGEYEVLFDKLVKLEWKLDYGLVKFNVIVGVMVVGVWDFFIVYNVNFNIILVCCVNFVVFDVWEQGCVKWEGGKVFGVVFKDENGNVLWEFGKCKGVKGIGWYIEEYGIV